MRNNITTLILSIVFFIPMVFAQIPFVIGYSQAQGNDGVLQLRVISESDAIIAGNGVVKIVLPDGTVGCADLVDTTDINASEIRVYTPYGTKAWRKSNSEVFCAAFGGSGREFASSITQTLKGEYILAGQTLADGPGAWSIMLVKTNDTGSLLWTKAIGGVSSDAGHSICATSDSGYAVTGHTYSFGDGSSDVLLMKFNSNDTLEWARYIGGSGWQEGNSIVHTSDKGFVVAGGIQGTGAGERDIFVFKVDSAGSVEWAKAIGGSGEEFGYSIVQTCDGGYGILGSTESYGSGNYDLLVIKLASDGNLEWAKAIGESDREDGFEMINSNDNGFFLTGKATHSFLDNLLVLKLNSLGNLIWGRELGELGSSDYGYSLVQLNDSSVVVVGQTYNYGSGVIVSRLTDVGILEWSSVIKENQSVGFSIIVTDDDALAIGGFTSYYGEGSDDFLLVKMGFLGESCCDSLIVPTMTSISPTFTGITPIVTNFTPDNVEISPIIESVTLTQTMICD